MSVAASQLVTEIQRLQAELAMSDSCVRSLRSTVDDLQRLVQLQSHDHVLALRLTNRRTAEH